MSSRKSKIFVSLMSCLKSTYVHKQWSVVLFPEIPSCRNENPEVNIKQNVTLDCTVNFAGNVIPTLDWQHGDRILNSTRSQHNSTNMRAYLRMVASDSMNGHIYNCHVAYPGLYSIMCQALPAMKIFSECPTNYCVKYVFHTHLSMKFLLDLKSVVSSGRIFRIYYFKFCLSILNSRSLL